MEIPDSRLWTGIQSIKVKKRSRRAQRAAERKRPCGQKMSEEHGNKSDRRADKGVDKDDSGDALFRAGQKAQQQGGPRAEG